MSYQYRVHIIQENETLDSIAKKYNLDKEELKNYHNKHANLKQRILITGDFNSNEIIIPPKGFTIKEGELVWLGKGREQKVHLGNKNKLFNKSYVGYKSYGILKRIITPEGEQNIKYEIEFKYYPITKKGNQYISVDKISKTYINDKEPEFIIDELAIKCTDILYPLILHVDENNRFKTIQNHEELLKRWEIEKPKLLHYYTGEVAQNYIIEYENVLMDLKLLNHYIQKDWLYAAYFTDIYLCYQNNFQIVDHCEFPVIPTIENVSFEVTKSLHRYHINDTIKIESKGKSIDFRNIYDIEHGTYTNLSDQKAEVIGSYWSNHLLNTTDHKIQGYYLEIELKLTIPKRISISISEIENKQLEEEKRHLDIITDPKLSEEKSIWKSIFTEV